MSGIALRHGGTPEISRWRNHRTQSKTPSGAPEGRQTCFGLSPLRGSRIDLYLEVDSRADHDDAGAASVSDTPEIGRIHIYGDLICVVVNLRRVSEADYVGAN